MNSNAHLQRSIAPRKRSTSALVASLDARHLGIAGVQGAEWRELRRRLLDVLASNAGKTEYTMSAADVVAYLYGAGFDKEPKA